MNERIFERFDKIQIEKAKKDNKKYYKNFLGIIFFEIMVFLPFSEIPENFTEKDYNNFSDWYKVKYQS